MRALKFPTFSRYLVAANRPASRPAGRPDGACRLPVASPSVRDPHVTRLATRGAHRQLQQQILPRSRHAPVSA